MDLKVYDCPDCGAPLPPAGLDTNVTCTSCGKQTKIEDGSDAVLREQKSRAEAEALFAKLGNPPSWSQRVAAALVNWKVWIVLFPILFGILVSISQIPEQLVESIYESMFHARLMHVANPVVGWLLTRGFIVVICLGLLVWSFLGQRIDARRELQAMLAAKPPATAGGPAQCRKCNAPLDVKPGTLGTRCPFCGADNLLVLPADWVTRARKSDSELRLTTKLARERAALGRKRLWQGALWRVPLVLVLLWFQVAPAWSVRNDAGWSSLRDDKVLLYVVQKKGEGRDVLGITRCARIDRMTGSTFNTRSSNSCDKLGCEAYAVFPLKKGETLRLQRKSPGDVGVRIALGPRYQHGPLGCWSDCGDELSNQNLPETEIVQPVKISGYYLVRLFSRSQDPIVVQPCVDVDVEAP